MDEQTFPRESGPVRRALSYFWGPVPWVIEITALASALAFNWTNVVIGLALLLWNAEARLLEGATARPCALLAVRGSERGFGDRRPAASAGPSTMSR